MCLQNTDHFFQGTSIVHQDGHFDSIDFKDIPQFWEFVKQPPYHPAPTSQTRSELVRHLLRRPAQKQVDDIRPVCRQDMEETILHGVDQSTNNDAACIR